jgi:molybdate transport system substrate-binding protein
MQVLFALIRVLAVLSLFTVSAAQAGKPVLIFAAASTAQAIETALKDFTSKTGIRAVASFASSGALARQIDSGAPANMYLSANRDWMAWIEKTGAAAPLTRKTLLTNRLVLIGSTDSNFDLKIRMKFPLVKNLGDNRLAIADPAHAPAGAYARAALMTLGVWDAVRRKTARTRDVRNALALVERGEAPLGIVYESDTTNNHRVRLLDSFPPASHPAIIYPLAILKSGDGVETRRLYDYLFSAAARKIFTRYGFGY